VLQEISGGNDLVMLGKREMNSRAYVGAFNILAFEGDSHAEWFEGNFQDYEEDKKRRLEEDSAMPKRIKYKQV
jgi:hypothetical protein